MEADRKELDESKQMPAEAESTHPGGGHRELRQRVFSMQRRGWNTDCRLRTNVKQLRETIMQGNEMFKETNYAKTNDQQWYEVASDSFDVRKTWTQCMSVSGQITEQCSAVRAGRSTAPRLSMTDAESQRTTPR